MSDPEKLVRNKKFEEGQVSNSPLSRSHTLLESIITEDIEFDFPFEHNLFISKSETFVSKTIIDEYKLKPLIPAQKLGISKFDRDIFQHKLEDLIHQLHKVVEKSSTFQ